MSHTPMPSQLVVGARSTIQGFDDFGFEINNVNYRGSVLVLPYITLMWDARTVADITMASLSPVHLVNPRISKRRKEWYIPWQAKQVVFGFSQTCCWLAPANAWKTSTL